MQKSSPEQEVIAAGDSGDRVDVVICRLRMNQVSEDGQEGQTGEREQSAGKDDRSSFGRLPTASSRIVATIKLPPRGGRGAWRYGEDVRMGSSPSV
jgi:hypothetical protein